MGFEFVSAMERLLETYKRSGLRQDADDYKLYREMYEKNLRYYQASGIKEQGFPTLESVEEASREHVAWRYREQMALYWGNLHSVGHGLTSLEDSSYEVSGVLDFWRNPKPVVFETITELNQPLQINLWIRPSCVYAGDLIEVDATLVNERQRLKAGTYSLKLSLVDKDGQVVHEKEAVHTVGSKPIEHLLTDSMPAQASPGRYHVRVQLSGGAEPLSGQRTVVIFDRKPRSLRVQNNVWVWEKGTELRTWLAARSIHSQDGKQANIRSGDLILITEGDADARKSILSAVRAGATAVILTPEYVFHEGTTDAYPPPPTYSDLLEALSEGWKPELRRIDWWGAPSAWGYTRTALALQHPYLAGLPQAKALEAQPEYQRVAPANTWLMNDPPSSIRINHAVRESSLAVDLPYCSDLFTVSVGSGQLVLNSLRIAQFLGRDPAADILLENILSELTKVGNSNAS